MIYLPHHLDYWYGLGQDSIQDTQYDIGSKDLELLMNYETDA